MNDAAQENDLDASIAAEIAKTDETENITDTATVVEDDVNAEAKSDDDSQATIENEAEPATAEEGVLESDPESFQKRMNKVTKDKHDETRRADAIQAELDALRSAQTPVKEVGAAPKIEDFDYDDEKYQAALIDHTIEKRMAASDKAFGEARTKRAQSLRVEAFNNKAKAYAEAEPDYQESIKSLPQFSADTLGTIMQLDNAPQMAHYLSKNLDVAGQVANLPPLQAAIMLGEIRAKLSTANKPKSKQSAAPAPVTTLASGSSQSKDIGEMTMAEIMNL